MRRAIVRYKLKDGRTQENEDFVRQVYAELAQAAPAGLRYATFKAEDGVTFFHVVSMENGQNPLASLPAFKTFTANIAERCVEPPMTTELEEVGSYNFFA
jgi:hypothetical protein